MPNQWNGKGEWRDDKVTVTDKHGHNLVLQTVRRTPGIISVEVTFTDEFQVFHEDRFLELKQNR